MTFSETGGRDGRGRGGERNECEDVDEPVSAGVRGDMDIKGGWGGEVGIITGRGGGRETGICGCWCIGRGPPGVDGKGGKGRPLLVGLCCAGACCLAWGI